MPSFTQVLNLSICASWLVLAVAAVRLILKKAPKALHCALWALVAIRLLLPVSIESDMSLVPSREVIPERYLTMEPVRQQTPAKLEIVTNPVYMAEVEIDTETTVDRVQNWDLYATLVWFTGMGAMAIYACFSYLSVRLRVRMAAWREGNVWECDEIDSPFILGLLRPRIYLPSTLDEPTRSHVLAHERSHLKRLDHIWKPLGFLLLTIHWFNPVMWLGYILLCRDIELACDERVIRNLDRPEIRAYSEALIACSVSHKMIAACPLAFGEVGVKGRIRTMLNYKKPGFWIILIALIVSVLVAVCFLTDPAESPVTLEQILEADDVTILSNQEQTITITVPKDSLPENVLNGREHLFEPEDIVVWENDSTRLYVSSARMSGDELLVSIEFAFDPAGEGEILLPYDIWDDSPEHFVRLSSPDVMDGETTYPNAGVRRSLGRDSFSLCVSMDAFNRIENAISWEVRGLYLIRYVDPENYVSDADIYHSGLTILEQKEQSRMLTIPMALIPEDLGTGDAVEFAECEIVVWEENGTILWLKGLEVEENQVKLSFDFSHRFGESGVLVLPMTMEDGGNSIRITNSSVWPDVGSCGNVLFCHANGPGLEFGVTMERYVFETQSESLSFYVDGLYFVTYLAGSSPAAELLGTDWQIAESLYANNPRSFAYQPTNSPIYSVDEDMYLTVYMEGAMWQSYGPSGVLQQIILTAEAFDEKFISDGWAAADLSGKLRQENEAAWICGESGAAQTGYLLLLQENGDVYLALTLEQGETLANLYRLEPHQAVEPEATAMVQSYSAAIPEAFLTPNFQLSSDGTFTFSENALSSYLGAGVYQLTEEELILQTSDGLYRWCFQVIENGFAFDAERSSPVTYYVDGRTRARLEDGTWFLSDGSTLYAGDAMNAAIETAVLEQNRTEGSAGHVCVQASRILDVEQICGVASAGGEGGKNLVMVYALVMYQEFSIQNGSLHSETANRIPAVLTFEVKDGEYLLLDYQTPRDGTYYAGDLEKIFTDKARQELMEQEAEYTSYLGEQCASAAEAWLREYGDQEKLLDIICAPPQQYSYHGAYINAHPEEYAQLVAMGYDTLDYCFAQFSEGNQMDLRGKIMALACQEIITASGERCLVENATTGQAWFNRMAEQAYEHLNRMSREEFEQEHPACAMIVAYLGA